MNTAKDALDLAVPYGMPRAGYSHNGQALCADVAERCLLLLWKSPQTDKTTTTPTNHLPSPAAAAEQATPHLLHTAEATFNLAVAHCMPRAGQIHTGRALCAVFAKGETFF